MPKYRHYPNESLKDQAEEIIRCLDNACPFDTTFLSTEEGCGSIGQNTPLSKAIQKAMEKKFRLWERSWIRPRAEELIFRLGKVQPPAEPQPVRYSRLLMVGEVITKRDVKLEHGRWVPVDPINYGMPLPAECYGTYRTYRIHARARKP